MKTKDKELQMIKERINQDIYNCEVAVENLVDNLKFKIRITQVVIDILKEIRENPFQLQIRFGVDFIKYELGEYSKVKVMYNIVMELELKKSLNIWNIDLDTRDSSVISLKRLN